MDENGHLKVIEDISKTARTTWVSLLVTLIFCAITLLSVSDRDFFEYGAQTKLPLVGVSVPVVGFFWSAPVLILALYLHLHIYLSRLWRALRRRGRTATSGSTTGSTRGSCPTRR